MNRSVISNTQQIIGSGGAQRKRKVNPIHHVFQRNALIKVDNENHHCLFYALQGVFVRAVREMNATQLNHYFDPKRRNKWNQDTLQLMNALNIPLDLEEYDAVEYARQVIDHWNARYERQFRFKVFIFGTVGHYRPKYKYGADDYTHPLLLIHDAEHKHFDGRSYFYTE